MGKVLCGMCGACVLGKASCTVVCAAACAVLQVGDSISCAVFDVLEGGKPVLTQRLPEEADDELAELAEELDQVSRVYGPCHQQGSPGTG